MLKGASYMKKIFKILIGIMSIFIIGVLYMSYLANHNQDYLDKVTQDIQNNYPITEEITSSNQYGNYYIITTTKQVIVLTKEYIEVLKEDISLLKENPDNNHLIYKTNQLMYEKTIRTNKNITYEYYDAKTGKQIKTTTLEQQ